MHIHGPQSRPIPTVSYGERENWTKFPDVRSVLIHTFEQKFTVDYRQLSRGEFAARKYVVESASLRVPHSPMQGRLATRRCESFCLAELRRRSPRGRHKSWLMCKS